MSAPPSNAAGSAATLPRTDVVVVSFNQRERLLACLASVAEIDPGIRLIVVDNASTDDSAEAARQAFPEAVVIEEADNIGFAAGVNRGAAAGVAPFILLLNNDARLRPDALTHMQAALSPDDVAAVGPRLLGANGEIELSLNRTLSPVDEARFKLIELLYRDGRGPAAAHVARAYRSDHDVRSLSGACILLKRQAFDDVGGFDERFFLYAEDVDLCRRLRAADRRLVYAAKAIVDHDRGASRATEPHRTALHYRRSQLAFYRKHHGRLAANGLRLYLALRFALERLFARGEQRQQATALLRWVLRESDKQCE